MQKKSNGWSWLWVVAICAALLVGARYLKPTNSGTANKKNTVAELANCAVPRTLKLARQKQNSLETYNKDIPENEILKFYESHTKKRISPESYQHLEALIRENALRKLWTNASQVEGDASTLSHKAMVATLQEHFPHEILTNADVVLFPEDSSLRIIVAEAASDFFRDTARHWKWIADYAEELKAENSTFKELDIYAAEELSEFLSVLAVGAVELAAADAPGDLVTNELLDSVFEKIAGSESDIVLPRESNIGFSEIVKEKLRTELPKSLFEEVTTDSKIDFVHRPKPSFAERRAILAVPLGVAGGGVAANDFNGDGKADLYFGGLNGGALYAAIEDGTFENVTESSGIQSDQQSRAGYFADFDNDGDNDLFITFVGARNRLFQNDGTGKFTDVSDDVGLLKDEFISHEAIWFDMDNDGLLDLYVANFGDWLGGDSPTLGRRNSNAPPNRLYRQEMRDGNHIFVEVAAELGVDDRGWTHCVGAFDFDRDGWSDLFSINDFGASLVYRNTDGTGFEEVSRELHMDDIYNGMSFTLLDLYNNSNFSIYVSQIMKLNHRQRYRRPTEDTKMQFDPTKKDNLRVLVTNRLFTRAFESRFRDDHDYRIEPAKLGWSWDVSGLDYENDSDIDLLALNGTESVVPASEEQKKDPAFVNGRNYLAKFNYEQNVFFIQEDGYFYDWSALNPIAFFGNSRSSTFVDFDDDGDLDVVVTNYSSKAKVFKNLQQSENNWVRFRLEGTRSNRNAIGAVVQLQFGDQQRFGTVVSGSGFLSQKQYELHFGLGAAEKVDSVTVQWPSGIKQELTDIAPNKLHRIIEEVPVAETK